VVTEGLRLMATECVSLLCPGAPPLGKRNTESEDGDEYELTQRVFCKGDSGGVELKLIWRSVSRPDVLGQTTHEVKPGSTLWKGDFKELFDLNQLE
jgi:hypothetical protein